MAGCALPLFFMNVTIWEVECTSVFLGQPVHDTLLIHELMGKLIHDTICQTLQIRLPGLWNPCNCLAHWVSIEFCVQ